jgi:hypothetical protein
MKTAHAWRVKTAEVAVGIMEQMVKLGYRVVITGKATKGEVRYIIIAQ